MKNKRKQIIIVYGIFHVKYNDFHFDLYKN